MGEEERPSFYAVIPATVRYDNELNANEKLLYGEITTLCQAKGICWASNRYFAELYNVTPQAISKWINHLDKKGYVSVEMFYKPNTKEVDKRVIALSEVSTQDLGGYQHTIEGYQQEIKENNNNINNNTIKKENIILSNDNIIKEKKTKKPKEPKEHFGEFKNVELTVEEVDKLNVIFGVTLTQKAITFLDEYIEEKGYKSKSHYLAIRRWVIDAVNRTQQTKPVNKKSELQAWADA